MSDDSSLPPWTPTESDPVIADQKLAKNPSAEGETDKFFRTPEERHQRQLLNERLKLENKQFKRDIKNREDFAERAYGFTQAWVGFVFVLTSCQFGLKSAGLGLTQTEFVTVVSTTTATILGFWLLVGKYLFKASAGDKEASKQPSTKSD